jgi:hypothetical protein
MLCRRTLDSRLIDNGVVRLSALRLPGERKTVSKRSACGKTFRVAASVAVVLAIAGCGQSGSEGQPPRLDLDSTPATEVQVLAAVKEAETATTLPSWITPDQLVKTAEDDWSLWVLPGCDPKYETTSLQDISPCTVGALNGAHTMVVIGDSNAFMWYGGLDFLGKRHNWRIVVLGKDNCGPAAMTYYQWQLKRDLTECDIWQTWRMDQIARIKPEVVLLSGWYDGGQAGPDRPLTPENWRDGLIKTINEMPPGTKTVLLGNIPHISKSPGECLAEHTAEISKCAEKVSDIVQVDSNRAIEQSAAATHSLYVDLTPWFCNQMCPLVIAGIIAYSGIYHITHDYARYLSGVLAEAMRPVMT